jgi:hypothetical protein
MVRRAGNAVQVCDLISKGALRDLRKPEPASLMRSCPRSFLTSRCSGRQDDTKNAKLSAVVPAARVARSVMVTQK